MTIYKHTQRGTPTITVIGGGVALLAGLAVYMHQTGHEAAWTPTAVAAILVATLLIFHSLNVEVGDGVLRLHYGIGFPFKTIDLSEVAKVEVVRNHWWYGWGIRYTPRGWLFNIAGLDAIELTFHSGRTMRIGTDEPEALCDAVRSELGYRQTISTKA